jgi:hypothetical protein
MTIEYFLGPGEILAGVRVLFAPGPWMTKLRRYLLIVVWFLWTTAGSLIAYLYFVWWPLACAARPRTRWQISGHMTMLAITGVWLTLGWIAWKCSRNPHWLREHIHALIAKRILSRTPSGTRTLTLTPTGFELQTPTGKHVREWSAVRLAKRDDRMLALATRDAWVFVPLNSLSESSRRELFRAVETHTTLLRVGQTESSVII